MLSPTAKLDLMYALLHWSANTTATKGIQNPNSSACFRSFVIAAVLDGPNLLQHTEWKTGEARVVSFFRRPDQPTDLPNPVAMVNRKP
jgi:hypothetical protein